jgi:hypothetical protein
MDRAPCPQCGDDSTVAGWADEPDLAHFFRPDGIHWLRHLLRHFGQNTHVSLPDRFRACLTCGLIWNSRDAEQLRELVGRESVAVGDEWTPPTIDCAGGMAAGARGTVGSTLVR